MAPRSGGAPLHVHHREDEWFFVLDGHLSFWIDGVVTEAHAGAFVYGPRGIPHTFAVRSETARFLFVTQPAGFEGFVRALSTPAAAPILPPSRPETPPDAGTYARAAEEFGIELLGPPGVFPPSLEVSRPRREPPASGGTGAG